MKKNNSNLYTYTPHIYIYIYIFIFLCIYFLFGNILSPKIFAFEGKIIVKMIQILLYLSKDRDYKMFVLNIDTFNMLQYKVTTLLRRIWIFALLI